jgi:2,3-bisphosphoglycerate-independent phosphoglycerate mutase
VKIHCFLDGRDTPPKSAIAYIRELEGKIEEIGIGSIATLIGRYYAMDRDNRWDRTKKAYLLLTEGIGDRAERAEEGIKKAYESESDEFVKPIVVDPNAKIEDGDSVIFFNFRSDRARQLTEAFIDKNFDKFERKKINAKFVSMVPYQKNFDIPFAFEREIPSNTFGEVVSKKGLRQLRIAETEKYAHVTFFFNGGREKPFANEDRCLIPSPKVATYDLKPEMSASKVASETIRRIKSNRYAAIIVNFANADMVGHTGLIEAGIKAAEVVDECVGDVVEAMKEMRGVVVIIGDHGNLEEMLSNGEPNTAHTTNPVPFILIGEKAKLRKGRLCDVAPTMLQLLKIEKPKEMTGKSLIV